MRRSLVRSSLRVWSPLLLLSIPIGLSSQEAVAVRIDGEPACPSCSIELEHVLELGDEAGMGFVGSTFHVARGSQYYYVTIMESPAEIRVFDHEGRFVRVVGRSGDGPGEFRGINGLRLTLNDTLYVHDRLRHRLTVLDPDLEFVRSMPLRLTLHDKGVVLAGEYLVMNGFQLTPDRVGLPIHVTNSFGEIVRSFGGSGAVGPEESAGLAGIRWLTPASGDRVWAAHFNEYILELWSLDGDLVSRIERDAEWFTAPEAEPEGPQPPQPQLLDLRQDADGRLWIMGRTADPQWRESRRLVDGGWETTRPELNRDFVIEVIDPSSGTLIASRRFPQFGGGFLDAAHVFTHRETNLGIPKIDVWRISFSREGGDR